MPRPTMFTTSSRILLPIASSRRFVSIQPAVLLRIVSVSLVNLRYFFNKACQQHCSINRRLHRRLCLVRSYTTDHSSSSMVAPEAPVHALPRLQLVVAAAVQYDPDTGAEQYGIGIDGRLPWQLNAEMKYFKELTTTVSRPGRKNAVIMGRKTWESLPAKFKPLPDRINIVLTRGSLVLPSTAGSENISPNRRAVAADTSVAEDVLVASSMQQALQQLAGLPNVDNVFVIGGGQVYAEALASQQCSVVHLTKITGASFKCDTFFPALRARFRPYSVSPARREMDRQSGNEVQYSMWVYCPAKDTPHLPPAVNSRHEEQQLLSQDVSLVTWQVGRHCTAGGLEMFGWYLDMIRDVMERGVLRGDRTGTGTYSLFGTSMRFNLRHSFPLLTSKRVFWRGVVEELLWFINGCTNAKALREKGVRIWDGNGSREYLDSIGLTHREEGDLGPVYGFQWRHFGAEYKDMHTDYAGQGVDQLADLIHRIKTNPNDRRLVLTAWNPAALKDMALPPCHMFCQFYVANGELSCQMYQRSCDLGLGVPFNIASYSLLTCMMAQVCNLKPGEFVHVLGDAHVYSNHVDPLREQLKNSPRAFPVLHINPKVKDIDGFTFNDFTLEEYNPHKPIPMKMAV